MARNSEKAQNLLNRYIRGKEEAARKPKQKRPFIATEVHNLVDAERWRQQVLRELGKKVAEIQNAALGEFRIREINDEINKLIREKSHWEKRIVELGGPNYAASTTKVLDNNGREAPIYAGYRYFGEAKNLPGIKDMILKPKTVLTKRNRSDLYRGVDADYYGFRDDEDGILVKLESEAEKEALEEAKIEWEERHKKAREMGQESEESENEDEDEQQSFLSHVPDLPTKKDVQQAILNKRKKELLKKYVSSDLSTQIEQKKPLKNKPTQPKPKKKKKKKIKKRKRDKKKKTSKQLKRHKHASHTHQRQDHS
eukprot:TRINITY_DN4870_c0_g1_i1.p1 TRINITY_DN4870_c0_g1~~TRINITY_DN4870_c0_g1_i1.p1  ORF type:complete len:340 (-),score=71.55 TRINITY_DN4870_c0_g1_i1:67-999(-)